MMLVKIDYMLIAVHNFEAAINYYQWVLNTTIDYQNLLTHADVEEVPMKVAERSISFSHLLSPTYPW